MACNLNFNQCNSGRSFPRPIFNCRCRLLSILNSSEITIVNPIVTSSALVSTITPQMVLSNGIVLSTSAFSSGDAINLTNGIFMLAEGRYLVSYSISGTIPSNGTFSFGLNENGFLVAGSESSTSGTVGSTASLTNSAIINVTAVSSLITLINTNNLSQGVTSGNFTIQKL